MIHKFDRNRCERFATDLINALAAEFSAACGSNLEVLEGRDTDDGEAEPEAVRIRLALRGRARGTILLELAMEQAVALASMLPPPEGAEPAGSPASTIAQFIHAVVPAIVAVLEPAGGLSMTPSAANDRGPSFTRINASNLAGEKAGVFNITLYMDETAMDSLSTSAVGANPVPQSATSEDTESPEVAALEVPNLDLVMDVELDVTLRFGKRQMTLREVLELTSGSVVELDRQVDEPVELLLDGKVIARGEAVVIDGNYGLRVTEVPQPVSPQQFRVP